MYDLCAFMHFSTLALFQRKGAPVVNRPWIPMSKSLQFGHGAVTRLSSELTRHIMSDAYRPGKSHPPLMKSQHTRARSPHLTYYISLRYLLTCLLWMSEIPPKKPHKRRLCVRLSLWLNHAFIKIEELICTAKYLLTPRAGDAGTTHKHYLYVEFYQSPWQHHWLFLMTNYWWLVICVTRSDR